MTNPTTPSADILEKVKELQKIVEKYDRLVLANAGSIYGTEITDLLPPILTFCLEQAEEIERLRGENVVIKDEILNAIDVFSDELKGRGLSPYAKGGLKRLKALLPSFPLLP